MVLTYLGLVFLTSYPKHDSPSQSLLEADLNLYSYLQIFLGACFLGDSLSLQIHNTHRYNAHLSSQDPSPVFSSLHTPIVSITIYLSFSVSPPTLYVYVYVQFRGPPWYHPQEPSLLLF